MRLLVLISMVLIAPSLWAAERVIFRSSNVEYSEGMVPPEVLIHWAHDPRALKKFFESPELMARGFRPAKIGKNMGMIMPPGQTIPGIYAFHNLLAVRGTAAETYGEYPFYLKIKPGVRILRVRSLPQAEWTPIEEQIRINRSRGGREETIHDHVKISDFDMVYFDGALREWIVQNPAAVSASTNSPQLKALLSKTLAQLVNPQHRFAPDQFHIGMDTPSWDELKSLVDFPADQFLQNHRAILSGARASLRKYTVALLRTVLLRDFRGVTTEECETVVGNTPVPSEPQAPGPRGQESRVWIE